MILIIGAPDEAHSAFIFEKLRQQGEPVAYLDTRRFPSETTMGLDPEDLSRGFLKLPDQPRIPLAEIKAIYWRYFMGIVANHPDDPFLQEMAVRETESFIGSLFRAMTDDGNCLWVNTPGAIDMHRYKGYQLAKLARAGLRVPHTLMTNDPDAVREFYGRMNKQVIYKPVRGGAHTSKLTDDDLSSDRLIELAKAPVQFQEMIPGVDTRAYLVGDDLFVAEIRAQSLDFRDDPDAAIVPVALPDNILADCRTLARELDLKFSGIDLRKTPDGEYVFIEGNPSPMFMHFERQSKYPISDRLVALLKNESC